MKPHHTESGNVMKNTNPYEYESLKKNNSKLRHLKVPL